MKIGIVQTAALLSILGFAAWLFLRKPGESATGRSSIPIVAPFAFEEVTGGSALPCAVPLGWRIARIDEGFHLNEGDAARALRRATALWERAVGRRLFTIDREGGSPVRFVYDERQAGTQERGRIRAEFEARGARLEARRVELEELKERDSRMAARYQASLRDFRKRGTSHTDTVRSWNQRGGAPVDVAERLRATGRALEEELGELRAREEELRALEDLLKSEAEHLNRDIEAHNRRAAAVQAEFPTGSIESGRYREAVRTVNGKIRSVQREIRIYRFTSDADLVRVIAHELGHALGLDHARDPAALMSAQFDRNAGVPGESVLRPSDVKLLRETCPAL